MNAQNIDNKPRVQKNTKRKIRVDFERTPLKERLKAKFLSLFFLKKIVWYIFRLILLIGISYIVLFPFFSKIAGSFMAPEDFVDATVRLIPKNFTLDIYKAIWEENQYLSAFFNTLTLSLSTALIQTFVCCFVAYGLAKFKFKGNGLVFLAVVFSLAIPHQTIQLAMRMHFYDFDVLGIVHLLNGSGIDFYGIEYSNSFLQNLDLFDFLLKSDGVTRMYSVGGINLLYSPLPLIIMSIGGIAFKNGLYIFMLRQFFRGVPDELEESAYIDGSGIMKTFFTIILPLSVPMMITVFLFAFSWQWMDDFYTGMFYTADYPIMSNLAQQIPESLRMDYAGKELYETAIRNTCGIMIILPLIVMYLFCQKYLVQGIERSGLTAD